MATNRKESEASFVLNSRRKIENAHTHPKITPLLDLFMTPEEREVGIELAKNTEKALEKKHNEKVDAKSAYDKYETAMDDLEDFYHIHKKKAKIGLKKDSDSLSRLKINLPYPKRIDDQFLTISSFYTELTRTPDYLTSLARVRMFEADILEGVSKVNIVDGARKKYIAEDGESQVATIHKNEMIGELDSWMENFDDMVELALMDNPQLKEILGVVVKS